MSTVLQSIFFTMDNIQKNPLKLYIQDIFRANHTESKYVYELFDMKFKNIMIHGVVTSVNNAARTGINFELSDLTGSIQIYYDDTKGNQNISDETVRDLFREFADASRFGDSNINIMNTMMDRITVKKKREIKEGMYLCVVGDIFIEDVKNVRMVSGYECNETSAERDIVWMEELRYLYEKFYLWEKK